jgi:hypothetical protein
MSSEGAASQGRRSPRIVARIPLDVQLARESLFAMTAVINLHGALIFSPVELPSGAVLNIRNQKTNRSIRRRVVRVGTHDAMGTHKVGVEFEAPESGFCGQGYSVSRT